MPVSVIVPVYNSENSLPQLLPRIQAVLNSHGGTYELIFVDDASRDGSWQVLREFAARDGRISVISLMRNYGQHNALLCGIRAARYETTVTLDDDLQHPPEEIPKLLDRLQTCDVVYGAPRNMRHGAWRNLASIVTKIALRSSMGAETARHVSAFRAFRTQLRDAFALYRSPFVSIDVLLTWGTTKFAVVEVQHEPRRVGLSNYTFRKLAVHALNMMTGFSTLPLQLASLMGFGFTAFGLLILAWVIITYLMHGGSVPGFPFLASIITIFSGAQMFALGIIGEYLARMHFRSLDRPPYTIREQCSDKRSTATFD